jgi:cation transport ATPase
MADEKLGSNWKVLPPTNSWRNRRRFMWVVIIFCMSCVAWVLWKELTSSIADTVVSMAFAVIMGTMGSYVFGAVWDDSNVRK